MRRAGVSAQVLACLDASPQRFTRASALRTSGLYRQMETTEKAALSFRLGMAMAAIVGDQALGVRQLHHLHRPPRSGRRADLCGRDRAGLWHVIEAKSRTYGMDNETVERRQSAGREHHPRTVRGRRLHAGYQMRRSNRPLPGADRRRLLDPPEAREEGVEYRFSEDEYLASYYCAVPDLLEVSGEPEPSGEAEVDRRAVGAWLPGGAAWLGLDRRLLGSLTDSRDWRVRLRLLEETAAIQPPAGERTDRISAGPDGHTFVIGEPTARP